MWLLSRTSNDAPVKALVGTDVVLSERVKPVTALVGTVVLSERGNQNIKWIRPGTQFSKKS